MTTDIRDRALNNLLNDCSIVIYFLHLIFTYTFKIINPLSQLIRYSIEFALHNFYFKEHLSKKREDAYREYLARLAAEQKLDERVKMVLLSNSSIAHSRSRDEERVLHRAQQVAAEEIPGWSRSAGIGWRRVQRIQELMQDEAFVHDALK
jgi:hypothetical protein